MGAQLRTGTSQGLQRKQPGNTSTHTHLPVDGEYGPNGGQAIDVGRSIQGVEADHIFPLNDDPKKKHQPHQHSWHKCRPCVACNMPSRRDLETLGILMHLGRAACTSTQQEPAARGQPQPPQTRRASMEGGRPTLFQTLTPAFRSSPQSHPAFTPRVHTLRSPTLLLR